ncbi:hypothetical protein [Rummeliibacillus stabekisii]|uniref:hypothetical protein n=1 Tax=Rummeliibacillus stabekisii TaxID=241244 RepID=UPI0011BE05AD|nr:hypothetical protein [Rummeliibacillus stabekisii]
MNRSGINFAFRGRASSLLAIPQESTLIPLLLFKLPLQYLKLMREAPVSLTIILNTVLFQYEEGTF